MSTRPSRAHGRRDYRMVEVMVTRLTAQQQATVGKAADALADDAKRVQLIERVSARLNLLGAFTDADVDDAVRLALCGLQHGKRVA